MGSLPASAEQFGSRLLGGSESHGRGHGKAVTQASCTALLVPAPEVAFIQPFRAAHNSLLAANKPPHLTVLASFLAPSRIDEQVLLDLEQAVASCPQSRFRLERTGCFPDACILFLVPEPAYPFLLLGRAIQSKFPAVKPEFAHPVMHLTLARGMKEERFTFKGDLYCQCGSQLPVEVVATRVWLYETCGDRWHERASHLLCQHPAP